MTPEQEEMTSQPPRPSAPAPDRHRDREADAPDALLGYAGSDHGLDVAEASPRASNVDRPEGMIPARGRRRTKLERGAMRILATGGIVGFATILGAVLVSQDVAGWIVGLAVGLTSVILAAVLWSSRQL